MNTSPPRAYNQTMRHLPIHLLCAVLLLAGHVYADEKIERRYDNGQIKESGFKNDKGQKVGEWIAYYNSGQKKLIIHFADGKVHGDLLAYFESGQLRLKEPWVHGKKIGEMISYWPNGQVKSTQPFANGNLHGVVIHYDKEGNVTKRSNYDNGKLVSSTD